MIIGGILATLLVIASLVVINPSGARLKPVSPARQNTKKRDAPKMAL
jgi:hypothetical protein